MLILLALFVPALPGAAGDRPEDPPVRYGLRLSLANTLGPDTRTGFGLASFLIQVPTAGFWPQPWLDELRLKVELSAGASLWPEQEPMASAAVFLAYPFNGLGWRWATPYAEIGIGGQWAQWHVRGQGSSWNFIPQAGLGLEFPEDAGGRLWFTALRYHHISNAGFHEHNRGADSLLLTAGFYF